MRLAIVALLPCLIVAMQDNGRAGQLSTTRTDHKDISARIPIIRRDGSTYWVTRIEEIDGNTWNIYGDNLGMVLQAKFHTIELVNREPAQRIEGEQNSTNLLKKEDIKYEQAGITNDKRLLNNGSTPKQDAKSKPQNKKNQTQKAQEKTVDPVFEDVEFMALLTRLDAERQNSTVGKRPSPRPQKPSTGSSISKKQPYQKKKYDGQYETTRVDEFLAANRSTARTIYDLVKGNSSKQSTFTLLHTLVQNYSQSLTTQFSDEFLLDFADDANQRFVRIKRPLDVIEFLRMAFLEYLLYMMELTDSATQIDKCFDQTEGLMREITGLSSESTSEAVLNQPRTKRWIAETRKRVVDIRRMCSIELWQKRDIYWAKMTIAVQALAGFDVHVLDDWDIVMRKQVKTATAKMFAITEQMEILLNI